MTEAELKLVQDLDARLNKLERENVRLRKGQVIDASGPILKVRMGGNCDNVTIDAVANGPVDTGDVVSMLEGNGAVVVTGPNTNGQQSKLDAGSGIVINGKELSVDSTVARKNGSGQLIAVANPSDPDHGVNKAYQDAFIAAIAAQLYKIPEVASLPVSPVNGDMVLFNDWLCRYDSSPANGNFPWLVLGGYLYTHRNDAEYVNTFGGSWGTPTTPMSLSIPSGIKGEFDITIGGSGVMYLRNGDEQMLSHSYHVGGVSADDSFGWTWVVKPYASTNWDFFQSGTRELRHTLTGGGGTVIAERWRKGASNDTSVLIQRRWLKVVPVRIGRA